MNTISSIPEGAQQAVSSHACISYEQRGSQLWERGSGIQVCRSLGDCEVADRRQSGMDVHSLHTREPSHG
jgi:hypothetical protein